MNNLDATHSLFNYLFCDIDLYFFKIKFAENDEEYESVMKKYNSEDFHNKCEEAVYECVMKSNKGHELKSLTVFSNELCSLLTEYDGVNKSNDIDILLGLISEKILNGDEITAKKLCGIIGGMICRELISIAVYAEASRIAIKSHHSGLGKHSKVKYKDEVLRIITETLYCHPKASKGSLSKKIKDYLVDSGRVPPTEKTINNWIESAGFKSDTPINKRINNYELVISEEDPFYTQETLRCIGNFTVGAKPRSEEG